MTIEELNDILRARGYGDGKRWGLDKTLDGEGFPPVVLLYPNGSHCVNMVVDEDSASDDFEWVYRMPESMGIADWLLSLHARFYAYSKYETEEDDGVAKKVLDELTGIIGDLMGRNGEPDTDTVFKILETRFYKEDTDCVKRWILELVEVSFFCGTSGRMGVEIWGSDFGYWDSYQVVGVSIGEWLLDTYDKLDLNSKSDCCVENKDMRYAANEIKEIIIDIMEGKGNEHN